MVSLWLSLQLRITFKKEDEEPEKIQCNEYYYAGGLVEYVSWMNADKVGYFTPLSSSICVAKKTVL